MRDTLAETETFDDKIQLLESNETVKCEPMIASTSHGNSNGYVFF